MQRCRRATDLLLWGWVMHLVADWVLQSEWMATRKQSFRHPAAYVHAGIHALAALLVFPPATALGLGAAHVVVDQRALLHWWRRIYRQTSDPQAPVYIPFSMGQDQAVHVLTIALAALLCGRQDE